MYRFVLSSLKGLLGKYVSIREGKEFLNYSWFYLTLQLHVIPTSRHRNKVGQYHPYKGIPNKVLNASNAPHSLLGKLQRGIFLYLK